MKTVCFGEIMLRLTPPGFRRLVQTESFCVEYGGAESNVAVSLANYGQEVEYITRLPQNDLGRAARNFLRRYGVGTDRIVWGGERLGIYYLEPGASQRASKVLYDRAGSAAATMSPSDFNWRELLSGAGWFHVTGITPAISPAAAETTVQAVQTAREMGLTVSCDVNFRRNLWSAEEAGRVMSRVLSCVDVCMAGADDLEALFDLKLPEGSYDAAKDEITEEGYRYLATALRGRFGIRTAAFSLRKSLSSSDNLFSNLLMDTASGRCWRSREYAIHIVDRIGGGDSFSGGLIYAMQQGYDEQAAVEFATAAAVLKHSIEGDVNLATLEEVQKLARSGGSGRVLR